MGYYYSKSMGTCYIDRLHPNIPGDAVKISEALYLQVFSLPVPGKVVQPGPDGLPMLVDAPQASAIPQAVSRFQARAALHLGGLLAQVEALMTDPATDMLARLAWSDAQEFRRTSPTVSAMAAALGLTEQQVDALFVTAAWIEA